MSRYSFFWGLHAFLFISLSSFIFHLHSIPRGMLSTAFTDGIFFLLISSSLQSVCFILFLFDVPKALFICLRVCVCVSLCVYHSHKISFYILFSLNFQFEEIHALHIQTLSGLRSILRAHELKTNILCLRMCALTLVYIRFIHECTVAFSFAGYNFSVWLRLTFNQTESWSTWYKPNICKWTGRGAQDYQYQR